MNDTALFNASVPVFRYYLVRIAEMIKLAPAGALNARLAPDAFCSGEHFRIAQGFVLRIVWPLKGRTSPEMADEKHDRITLLRNCHDLGQMLEPLGEADFSSASERVIDLRAGFADLSQSATEFLTLYGLPNFYFHVANAYATLRQSGIKIGKSDFDGLHIYPPDFNFGTGT